MYDPDHFEEEEEALFASTDFTKPQPPKGLRLVPTFLVSDFIAWLDTTYPEIKSIHDLNEYNIEQLIAAYECAINANTDYTGEEWLRSLQRL
uniref:Uncharacterized protein n=1 Tax=Thermosporothrix sp. COM3 TaxID=2490863 RepID=A0A455SEV1_9CHLR|nr:hypothetical protein KTC_17480 [Thermosporothrix sp. COM3]